MLGDRIIIKDHHRKAARAITEFALPKIEAAKRFAITVAGESGAGKSEIATALKDVLDEKGIATAILQQDDYFIYPPKTNHRFRLADVRHVGTGEVRRGKMDADVRDFLGGANIIAKPLVDYDQDRVGPEKMDVSGMRVIIAEGTYTTLLDSAGLRVFIERDYIDTKPDRIARARDPIDEFTWKVLDMEHEIIAAHRARAHLLVGRDFSVREAD